MTSDYLQLEQFAQTSYHKCECCNRVRDIYYRLNVRDCTTGRMLVGSFELCKECGQNMGDILHVNAPTEGTVTEFSFDK